MRYFNAEKIIAENSDSIHFFFKALVRSLAFFVLKANRQKSSLKGPANLSEIHMFQLQ